MKNKLVRDKIKDLFPEHHYHKATSDLEYWKKLKEKLREEVEEFLADESAEELADVLEVLDAIYEYKQFSRTEVKIIQLKKAKKRGKFRKRIILEQVGD